MVGRQPARRARAIALAISVASLLATSAAAPAAAAPPARGAAQFGGGGHPDRQVSQRRVASAREAAKLAAHERRPVVPRSHPHVHFRNARTRSTAAPTPLRSSAGTAAAISPSVVTVPEVAPVTQFAGLSMAEAGLVFPPDPWVAANSTYVVQSVNSAFRVTNRAGVELAVIPTASLFDLPSTQNPTDGRVIWDATHGRWVAIASSWVADDSDDYLNLAVSETADPTGAWVIHTISFGAEFPDYPSVASSNDKIVITDNLFDQSATFVGADLNTFTWASLLAAGPTTYNFCTDSSYIHPRAAQVLSSANDVHLVMADSSTGDQWYFRLTGAGACGSIVDGTQFNTLDPFADPPDPRQDGDPLTGAIDGRPTDAVWQSNQLWWVSTAPVSYDAGATFNDAVVLQHATTVASGSASVAGTYTISAGDGIDDFMGGIGLTRNGTLIVTYSESSPSTFISLRALRLPAGGSLDSSIQLDLSDAALVSSPMRWGDFAGVAMDPVGGESAWVTHELAASDGTWRTTVARLVVDDDYPSTPGPMTASLVTPTTLGTVSVRLSWGAATDGDSGVRRYLIEMNEDGDLVPGQIATTGTSVIRQLSIGHTYVFRVHAEDWVGSTGTFRLGPTLKPYLYQSTSSTVYSTGWSSSSSAVYSGGSTKYTSTAGRTATFTATSARAIAIVATKASTRGSFKVYVDGVYKATISTYSTTTKYRQLVYQFAWTTPGTHKVQVVTSGTSGHPRVDLDAFVVLR